MTVEKPGTTISAKKKSEATRQRILDAAAETFRHRGYAATRLSDIADAAHTQAGSLYYYFSSKDELLEEVLNTGVDRVYEAVVTAVDNLPPGTTHRQRITTAVMVHLQTMLSNDDYSSANIRNFGQVPEDMRARHILHHRRYTDYWRDLFHQAAEAGEIRRDLNLSIVRMLVFGALNWALEWYKNGTHSAEDVGKICAAMIFEGMQPNAQ